MPDPQIQEPTDAIIQVTSTAICGSDLHLYGVLGPYLKPGRRARPRGHGDRRGDRRGRHPPAARRPGGDPVQHLLRALLDVLARAFRPVRDDPGHETRARAPRCSATPRCTARCRAARPSILRVPQAQFGPVKVPDGAPTSSTCTCPTSCPPPTRPSPTPTSPKAARSPCSASGRSAVRGAHRQAPRRRTGHRRRPRARAAGGRSPVRHRDRLTRERRRHRGTLIELTGGRGPDAVIDAVGMEAHGYDERPQQAGRAGTEGHRAAAGRAGRARSPTRPRLTGSTHCTRRSRRSAAAAPSRSAASTAARSTRCR